MPFRNDKFIGSVSGPFATVRYCKLCDFKVITKKGLRGVGKGHGLREGGRAIGELRRHVRDEHPEELAAVKDDWWRD
jgi:hypothetical protein